MADLDWKNYFDNKAKTNNGSVMTSNYYNEKSFYIQRQNTMDWLGTIKGKVILDAGCGIGAFSENLTKENKVFGVDFSGKSLEYAKNRGLETHCGDLVCLPYENDKFDLCLCIGVIQHIKEYKAVLKELTRVIKPGGTLLIETLNSESILRKMIGIINKKHDFDTMYKKDDIGIAFKELGFQKIEFLTLYQPFSFKTIEQNPSIVDRYIGTSFAIKGIKM